MWDMAAPVKPSDFEALIVEDTDKLCVALRKTFLELPVLLWKLVNWMFTTVGSETNISAAFRAPICDAIAECPDLTAGTTTTTP